MFYIFYALSVSIAAEPARGYAMAYRAPPVAAGPPTSPVVPYIPQEPTQLMQKSWRLPEIQVVPIHKESTYYSSSSSDLD